MAKRVLTIAAWLLGSLTLLIVLAVFSILIWPSILINQKNLDVAEEKLLPPSLEIKKEDLVFNFGRAEGLRYKVRLKADSLRLWNKDTHQTIQFKDLETVLNFHLFDVLFAKSYLDWFHAIENGFLKAPSVSFESRSNNEKLWILTSLDFRAKPEGFDLQSSLEEFEDPSQKLDLKTLDLKLQSSDLRTAKGQISTSLAYLGHKIKINGGINFDFRQRLYFEGELATKIRDPKKIGLPRLFSGPVKGELSFTKSYKVERFRLDLDLDDKKTDIVEIKTILNGSGDVFRFDPRAMELNYDVNIAIKEFQVIVRLLQTLGILIPAPFSSLKGTTHLKGAGSYENLQDLLEFNLVSDLRSKNQTIELNSEVTLQPLDEKTGWLFSADTSFEELALILPQINTPSTPQLLQDKRIYTSRKEVKKAETDPKKKEPLVQFDVRAETASNSPAKINITKYTSWIPFHFDVHYQNKQLDGSIRIDPFTAELFRREAKIRRFQIKLKEPRKTSALSGLIEVDYADYRVDITVEGTFEKPYVGFESDPPLDRDQVIAVLLFGRPLDDLTEGQNRSVGNLDAALTSRALTLVSMYLLASTPIESVTYNPAEEEFVAQFRLPGDVSLRVGADEENINRLGLQKYLGNGFLIRTEMENLDNYENQKVIGILEWFTRY